MGNLYHAASPIPYDACCNNSPSALSEMVAAAAAYPGMFPAAAAAVVAEAAEVSRDSLEVRWPTRVSEAVFVEIHEFLNSVQGFGFRPQLHSSLFCAFL